MGISKHREELTIRRAAEYLTKFEVFSIAHENLFRVFDICSKSKQGLNRKLGNKIVKFYVKILYSLVMIC